MSLDKHYMMTVQEMIEAAFGNEDKNVVNFKLIETILMLLGKQLNVLNRRVAIQDPNIIAAVPFFKNRLSVSEIKIHACIPRDSKTNSLSDSGNKIKGQKLAKGASRVSSSLIEMASSMPGPTVDRTSKVGEVFQSKKYFGDILDKIEQQREKVLRVMHQRVDSHDEGVMSPTPITSLQSTEILHEKLLVVKRLAPEEAERVTKSTQSQPRQLTIVSQDEFGTLAKAVADLQTVFQDYETPEFPENIELMKDLRKKASLTEAMAALQISARLDAAEKAITSMTEMITELAKRPISVTQEPDQKPEDNRGGPDNFKQLFTQTNTVMDSNKQKKSLRSNIDVDTSKLAIGHNDTLDRLEKQLQKMYEDIQAIEMKLSRAEAKCTTAMKIAKKFEEKIEQAIEYGSEVKNLQLAVQSYTEQVNAIDAGLSSQLVNYQEQLNQMEFDLETGMEHMQDALLNKGVDAEAIAEINARFTSLLRNLDNTKTTQKELEAFQADMSLDILKLRNDVEMLRDSKSDRDEVADVLRDKAGLKDLNGMVNEVYFSAVVDDLQKRLTMFYRKVFDQEVRWQQCLDDFANQFREKADWVHLVSLRDDINKHLETHRERLHVMADILGEPTAAAVTRKLNRDTACLSCATPAIMNPEPPKLPTLPALRPPTVAVEDNPNTNGGGDFETFYSGQRAPRQNKDTRSEMCTRYCGGEHTKTPHIRTRVPPELHVKPMQRVVGIAQGSDGKTYHVDQPLKLKPCIPCNAEKSEHRSEPKKATKAATKATKIPAVSSVNSYSWNSEIVIGSNDSFDRNQSISLTLDNTHVPADGTASSNDGNQQTTIAPVDDVTSSHGFAQPKTSANGHSEIPYNAPFSWEVDQSMTILKPTNPDDVDYSLTPQESADQY